MYKRSQPRFNFSVTFNELYQMIIVKFYEEFAEEDEYFFEKSKLLADMNVTAEQFGGNENHAIHFTAAVSTKITLK